MAHLSITGLVIKLLGVGRITGLLSQNATRYPPPSLRSRMIGIALSISLALSPATCRRAEKEEHYGACYHVTGPVILRFPVTV